MLFYSFQVFLDGVRLSLLQRQSFQQWYLLFKIHRHGRSQHPPAVFTPVFAELVGISAASCMDLKVHLLVFKHFTISIFYTIQIDYFCVICHFFAVKTGTAFFSFVTNGFP